MLSRWVSSHILDSAGLNQKTVRLVIKTKILQDYSKTMISIQGSLFLTRQKKIFLYIVLQQGSSSSKLLELFSGVFSSISASLTVLSGSVLEAPLFPISGSGLIVSCAKYVQVSKYNRDGY